VIRLSFSFVLQFIALGRTDGSLQLLDHTGVVLVDRAFYALVRRCLSTCSLAVEVCVLVDVQIL
jgi:hypothetical protein